MVSDRGKLLDNWLDLMDRMSVMKAQLKTAQDVLAPTFEATEKQVIFIAPSGWAVMVYKENNTTVIKRVWKQEA